MSQYPFEPRGQTPQPAQPADPPVLFEQEGSAGSPRSDLSMEGDRTYPGVYNPPRERRRWPLITAGIIVLASVAAVFVFTQVFTLRTVEVMAPEGQNIYVDQLLVSAGLDRPVSMFSVQEETVRAGVEQERYLEFLGMEKVWPNRIILRVRVRHPVANVLYMGMQYLLADDGMVLARYSTINTANDCPIVSEMGIRDIRVGSIVTCTQEARLRAYSQIMRELEERDMLGEIASVNVGSINALILQTRDGYTVNLGPADEIHGRMGTAQAVLKEVRAREYRTGIINISAVGEANYQPTVQK